MKYNNPYVAWLLIIVQKNVKCYVVQTSYPLSVEYAYIKNSFVFGFLKVTLKVRARNAIQRDEERVQVTAYVCLCRCGQYFMVRPEVCYLRELFAIGNLWEIAKKGPSGDELPVVAFYIKWRLSSFDKLAFIVLYINYTRCTIVNCKFPLLLNLKHK